MHFSRFAVRLAPALILLLVLPLIQPPPLAAAETPTPFQQAQAALIKQREAVMKPFDHDLEVARNRALNGVEKWLEWCVDNGFTGNTSELFTYLVGEYPRRPWSDKVREGYVTPAAPIDDKAKLVPYNSRRDSALQGFSTELIGLERACMSVQIYDKAYDLLQEIIRVNPEDRTARTFLGYIAVINPETRQREWLTKIEQAHRTAGEEFVPTIGWVPAKQADRYRSGDFCENGKWSTMAEANARHADMAHAWVVQGPHFEVHSNLPRVQAFEIAMALEDLYRNVYREYLPYFAQDSRVIADLFDAGTSAKPLVVNFFANQAEFQAFIREKVGGVDQVQTLLNSQGFYYPDKHQSYFYRLGDSYLEHTVAFHEATHQILGEFIPDSSCPAWLVEMPAVYIERLHWQSGRIVAMPFAISDPERSLMLEKSVMTVSEYTAMTEQDFHSADQTTRLMHYAMAGGITDFLLTGENGIYHRGFVEFMRARYLKKDTPALHEFVGLSSAELDAKWKAFAAATYVNLRPRSRQLRTFLNSTNNSGTLQYVPDDTTKAQPAPAANPSTTPKPATATGTTNPAKPATPPSQPTPPTPPNQQDGEPGRIIIRKPIVRH